MRGITDSKGCYLPVIGLFCPLPCVVLVCLGFGLMRLKMIQCLFNIMLSSFTLLFINGKINLDLVFCRCIFDF